MILMNQMMACCGVEPSGELTLIAGKGIHSGTASASTSISNRGPEKAFDNSLDPNTGCWHSDDALPSWIKYDFGTGNEKTLKRYGLCPRNDPGYLVAGPVQCDAWTFEGSNNNANWDVLDSQSGQSDLFVSAPSGTVPEDQYFLFYDLANTTAYRYYRVFITANHPDRTTDHVQIGELAFYE